MLQLQIWHKITQMMKPSWGTLCSKMMISVCLCVCVFDDRTGVEFEGKSQYDGVCVYVCAHACVRVCVCVCVCVNE